MRVVVSVLCALFLTLPVIAQEKKSGEGLAQRGISSYLILETANGAVESTASGKTVRVELRSRQAVVAIVTIEARSAADHIITYEPVGGEAFVIEALMSRMELTFRTEHERVTATFNKRDVKWDHNGSESLFARVLPDVETAGLLVMELQARGVLASEGAPSAPAAAGSSPCSSQKFSHGVSSDFAQDPGTDTGDGSSGPCTGITHDCSGGALSWTMACSKAKASCNQSCWNSYCTGCCKFTTCVYACIGSWCAASFTGTACSATDRP
jgi:hypothetical protein